MFRLETEFYRLPLRCDAERLAREVAQFSEADWRPHPQGHAGNSALLLATVGGGQNDEVKGPMLPTPLLGQCPYIRQVLAALGAVIGRARFMRIDGQADATEHVDTNYYWMHHVRVHIPAVTHPEVRFLCQDQSVHMAPGEVWIFDSWKRHNVVNPADSSRIHLVVDTVGSAAFWDLVRQAGRPFADGGRGVEPQEIPFREGWEPELAFETENYPVVMSPFEQALLGGRMLGELSEAFRASREGGRLRESFETLNQEWHGLWTRFHDRPEGWPFFRRTMEEFDTCLTRLADGVRLNNGVSLAEALRQAVIRPALSPEVAEAVRKPVRPLTARRAEASPVRRLDRPVFVVAAPRSGSSLLFELLSLSPGVWTVGGESHALIEGLIGLHPAENGYSSNRLTEREATPEAAVHLHERFLRELRNRRGDRLPEGAGAVRLLEKTPKNALRIPFLRKVFPGARFIYLHREAGPNLASIIEAWKSGCFVTYPELPDWPGPAWSLLLIPGWRELAGRPLEEIAVRQWTVANQTIQEDLAALPRECWCGVRYEDLLAHPQEMAQRLSDFAGWNWDHPVSGPLPHSRHTLTPPNPLKWKIHEAALAPFLDQTLGVSRRALEMTFEPAGASPSPVISPLPTMTAPSLSDGTKPSPSPEADFSSEYTAQFPHLLQALGASLAVSTYQAGKLIFLRAREGQLNTHFRDFPSPMGIAYDSGFLALGTQHEIRTLRNFQHLGPKVDRRVPPDAVFLPAANLVSGDIRVHDIAWGRHQEIWAVNTRFSCLCTFDGRHNFLPRWRPPFVTALAAEDRCHLNGLAMRDGVPAYVTCHAATDTPEGWREHKLNGGCLLEVATGEILARGLCMPHSPRWHEGKLWFLESGYGRVCVMDPETRKTGIVAELPGFTRGLDFCGQFAFVGLSQVRESAVFSGIPVSEPGRERHCGVWVLDLSTGQIAAFLRFSGCVQEVFAVQALPFSHPDLLLDEPQMLGDTFFVPSEKPADEMARPSPALRAGAHPVVP